MFFSYVLRSVLLLTVIASAAWAADVRRARVAHHTSHPD